MTSPVGRSRGSGPRRRVTKLVRTSLSNDACGCPQVICTLPRSFTLYLNFTFSSLSGISISWKPPANDVSRYGS